MKRKINLLIIGIVFLISVLSLSACLVNATVYLKFMVDGKEYASIETFGNELITMPEAPTKEGYEFDGWFFDDQTFLMELKEDTLINSPIEVNTKVYAKFKVDSNHTHTYEEEWTYDETHHYKKATCVHSDNKGSYGEHNFDERNVCIKCKYQKPFSVQFKNYDGSLLANLKILNGETITPPTVPNRKGFEFVGWDKDFAEISQDCVINAIFKIVTASNFTSDGVSYTNSYSLLINENKFSLRTLTVGNDSSRVTNTQTGSVENVENNVIKLVFDDKSLQSEYVKEKEEDFLFCNLDGSVKDNSVVIKKLSQADEKQFQRLGNSFYGYNSLAYETNGDKMQRLYYDMFLACETFFESTENLSGNLDLTSFKASNYGLTLDEVKSVWKIFYLESPLYYWLDNTVKSVGDDELFLSINSEYAVYSKRQECNQQVTSMFEEFSILVKENMSSLEVSLLAHNFILDRIDYAYEEDGTTPRDDIWAHNIIGTASGKNGVCESYAKTFMALCLQNNVECIMVSGMGDNEAHAWNLLNIDGLWYGVDVTWDDIGSGKKSYNNFCTSNSYLYEKHTPSSSVNYGMDYLYNLPSVCENGIQLVKLYKDGNYLGLCKNIDFAFGLMNDENGSYEIKLFEYAYEDVYSNIEFYVNATNTPMVKDLKITSTAHEYNGNFYANRVINIISELAFLSNVTLKNVDIKGKTINLNSFTLTLDGQFVGVENQKLIGGNNSKIITKCLKQVGFAANIDAFFIQIDCSTIFMSEEIKFDTVSGSSAFYLRGEKVKTVKVQNLKNSITLQNCNAPYVEICNLVGNGTENITFFIVGLAQNYLPQINVTGELINTKIYFAFSSYLTSGSGISKEELLKYKEYGKLKPNQIIIKGENLKCSDLYIVQEENTKFSTDGEIDGKIENHTFDVSTVLRKDENNNFVFLGWND